MDTVGGAVASGKRRYAGCPLGGAKLIRHDFPLVTVVLQMQLRESWVHSLL